jgi:hypothetical protein
MELAHTLCRATLPHARRCTSCVFVPFALEMCSAPIRLLPDHHNHRSPADIICAVTIRPRTEKGKLLNLTIDQEIQGSGTFSTQLGILLFSTAIERHAEEAFGADLLQCLYSTASPCCAVAAGTLFVLGATSGTKYILKNWTRDHSLCNAPPPFHLPLSLN